MHINCARPVAPMAVRSGRALFKQSQHSSLQSIFSLISYTQSILSAYSIPNLPVLIVSVCCCILHVETVVSELIQSNRKENSP